MEGDLAPGVENHMRGHLIIALFIIFGRLLIMITISELIEELEVMAPPELADEGDRIGLQAGRPGAEVDHICVSVDTSPDIIDKVIEQGAGALVAHHPLIYSPLRSMAEDNPVTRRLAKLIRSDIAVYVMHTNYDTVSGGINDVLAERIGVQYASPLTNRHQDKFYKIVVFVPEEAVEDVRNAMADAGAGLIGLYTHCSFRVQGTGSFVPMPSAQPYVGEVGKLEEVDEYRLEMVCAGSWVEYAVEAMIDKHPYDEVAYDLYELANEPIIYGYGRVGTLQEETTLGEYADRVISTLGVKFPKVIGDPNKKIKRVAFCGGGGSSLFHEAADARADVYVTGDTKHHDILDAEALGLAVIDAGHFETERPGMISLTERLKKTYAGSGVKIEYIE